MPSRPVRALLPGLAVLAAAGLLTACSAASASDAPGAAPQAEAPAAGGQSASSAPPAPRYDGPIFALGDSVMLGAQPCLEKRGMEVDAKGSRQISAGLDLLRDSRADLPPRVVIHLGTNGGLDEGDIAKVMKVLGPDRVVTWVTIQLPNDYSRYTFEDRTNDDIRAAALRYPNARVVDWNTVSGQHEDYFWGDGYHVTPDGCKAYAKLVNRTARS